MAGREKRERKEGKGERQEEREGGRGGGMEKGGKRNRKEGRNEEREGTNPWTGKTRVYRPGALGLLAGFVGLIGRSAGLLFSRV